MNDISDGELKFTSREELEAWLKTQPREVSVVIAARAALRVAPTLAVLKRRLLPEAFAEKIFATLWADAFARVAVKYPDHAKIIDPLLAADVADLNQFAPATEAAALAADAAHLGSLPLHAAVAAVQASLAAAIDTDKHGDADIWLSVSADANRLNSVAPSAVAGEKLWPEGAPQWAKVAWRDLQDALTRPHWKPWRDWYQRRLDGREEAEEIELQFATLPIDPRHMDVAEQNAELAAEIARLPTSRVQWKKDHFLDDWDYFISYSDTDEADAREISAVLEDAGYTTFARFKDKDFASADGEAPAAINWSHEFVALLSPAYDASDRCRAEWTYVSNLGPDGLGKKILPLLVRKTNLNALASQIVYVDLVGLSGEARRQAILRALAPKPLPNPIENISAPFDFGWNAAHRIAVVAGPQNTPIFPFAGSDHDHRDRLDACRKTVERLLADLAAQRFNARPDYRLLLETYLDELPAAPGGGNLLLADAEARVLRGLFEEDVNILSRALAERLNRILEFHIALRPFYPGVGRFYDDARSGALSAPLPRDAIAGFVETVREYTPEIFEPSVSRGIDKVEEDFAPHPAAPAPQLDPGVLAPRPDPIDAPDPEKTQAYSLTSTINAVYRVFREGKDMAAAIKGWDEAAQKLGEHAGPVIEFLKSFLPNA